MDVSFTRVVEGTRQYFLGVPAPPCWPPEPSEPAPHVIHKASVVREAMHRQQQLQRCAAPAQPAPPPHQPHPPHQHHQPRPTVSVTSLVHQMNQSRHRRDSPLDLSLKTVKHSADSTADRAPPAPPAPPYRAAHRASHKVDFSPDFRAQYSRPAPPAHHARRPPPPAYIVDNRYQPAHHPRYTTAAGDSLRCAEPPRPRARPRRDSLAERGRLQRDLLARPVYSYSHHQHDARVLSILRSSLESRARASPHIAATIVIDDDEPCAPPAPAPLSSHIRYAPPLQPPHSPDTDATPFRTKAELKGYTHPSRPAAAPPPPPAAARPESQKAHLFRQLREDLAHTPAAEALLKCEPINIEEIERDAMSAPPRDPTPPPRPPTPPDAPREPRSPSAPQSPPSPSALSAPPSPGWADTCDSFLRQLKTGFVRKKTRRKRELYSPQPVDVKPHSCDTSVDIEPAMRLGPDAASSLETEPAPAPDSEPVPELASQPEPEPAPSEPPLTLTRIKLEKPEESVKMEPEPLPALTRVVGCESRVKTEPTRRRAMRRRAGGTVPTREQLQQMEQAVSVKVVDILRVKREPESSDDDQPLSRSRPQPAGQARRARSPRSPRHPRRPRLGFGDGSDWTPGWESEVYRYKRSLRMPSRLISPWLPQRAASSLPELESSPAARHADSDLDSGSRLGYDSEASCSTVFSAATAPHPASANASRLSILDILMHKCGQTEPSRPIRRRDPASPVAPPAAPAPQSHARVPAPSLREVFGAARRDAVRPRRAARHKAGATRDGLRSTSLKKCDARGRLMRLRKRNVLLKQRESGLGRDATRGRARVVPARRPRTVDPAAPPVKRIKRLFARRKLSSGFDYIRKKKRAGASVAAAATAPSRRPAPECALDIDKEIKSWFINKSVGETALHRAARLGYPDCAAHCLVRRGCAAGARDNAGYTPLHVAAARGHVHTARLLLQHGADVSAPAQGGVRPLHEACENGHAEMVRLLLAYGADPLLATYAGATPGALADAAAADGRAQAADLLRRHLQDVAGGAEPWRFPPVYASRPDDVCDALASPPPASPPPPEEAVEVLCSEAPLPPFYSLRPGLAPGAPRDSLWCLLHDLAPLLHIKSRESLVRQVREDGAGGEGAVLLELRTHEFLERARCLQLLGAGEKVNVRGSRVALVRLTPRLQRLLRLERTRLQPPPPPPPS